MRIIMIISGILMIAFGIILLTNRLKDIAGLFPDFGIKF